MALIGYVENLGSSWKYRGFITSLIHCTNKSFFYRHMKISLSLVIFIGFATLISCKPKGLKEGIYHLKLEEGVHEANNLRGSNLAAQSTWDKIGIVGGMYAAQRYDTMVWGVYSQNEDSLILKPSGSFLDSSMFSKPIRKEFMRQSYKVDGESFYEERVGKNGEKVIFRYEWQGDLNSLSKPTQQEASEPSE